MNKRIFSAVLMAGLALPLPALAADALEQKVDNLTKEIEALKQQVKKTEEKSLGRWLSIGGDYRFRFDYLNGNVPNYWQGYIAPPNPSIPGGYDALYPPIQAMPVPDQRATNSSMYTNRFGLNLKVKATEDVTVNARLLMYKVFGAQTDDALRSSSGVPFSFDRAGIFDGTVGHVPDTSFLAVDQAYATWSNILDQPIWFSVGRRPATGGVPTNLRQNREPSGVSGVPGLLIDYAFDGMTLGWAPDIESLPGAYAKFCYGRGFQNNINYGDSKNNMDFIGVNLVPYETDTLRAEFQYNHAFNIFDAPDMLTGPFSFLEPTTTLGSFDAFGLDFLGKVKNVGFGDLTWFTDFGMSITHANGNTLQMTNPYLPAGSPPIQTPYGLLWTGFGTPQNHTGWALYLGGRYDIKDTGTKLGFEYNHGSKYWLTFAPAADDLWTSKLGTRGNVYETYIIQELKLKPISSILSKVFFKLGYQYYDFDYTGSNSWIGAPLEMASLTNPMNAQLTTPLTKAQDVYFTFEVHF
jgi:hypothetical protein